MEVTDAGSTEVVNETVEPTTEAVTVETGDAGTAQLESTEAEVDFSADKKDTGKDNQRCTCKSSGFPAFQPCIPHAVRKAMTLLCT